MQRPMPCAAPVIQAILIRVPFAWAFAYYLTPHATRSDAGTRRAPRHCIRPTRVNALASTWPLLLGMGILMLGAGLQSTLLSLRATLEAFPPTVTGLVMSCYYIGYLGGTVGAPPLLRRIGH